MIVNISTSVGMCSEGGRSQVQGGKGHVTQIPRLFVQKTDLRKKGLFSFGGVVIFFDVASAVSTTDPMRRGLKGL